MSTITGYSTAKQNPIPIRWEAKNTSEKIPALTMLVNPANLETIYSPLITETRTLGGFAHEYWGEQLTSLTAAGKTAMFMDDTGLTNNNARNTKSYQYFMNLLNIYKNNGKSYYQEYSTPASKRNETRITAFGYVEMNFDHRIYEGYFDSFTVTESAAYPFNLDYNFSFKVMKIVGMNMYGKQTI